MDITKVLRLSDKEKINYLSDCNNKLEMWEKVAIVDSLKDEKLLLFSCFKYGR